LARHEPDIRAVADAKLSLSELLMLLGNTNADADRDRYEAISCFLSASEGWSEAAQRLGGAFAAEAKELRDKGLSERKAD
jgi:hypothetical protein